LGRCCEHANLAKLHEDIMLKPALSLATAALLLSVQGADAQDRHLRIHNDTGLTLYKFQSTNSGAKNWGRDVMGSNVLPDGASMRLNFDNSYGYCEFDFKATFEDGTVLQKARVNVCATGDYYYTE
jgi:hypothetical protein